jgi:hypothetical protein
MATLDINHNLIFAGVRRELKKKIGLISQPTNNACNTGELHAWVTAVMAMTQAWIIE